jgi:hypothetical protein
MINNWLSTLREFGTLVREIYLVPGDFVLSKFAELAPVTATNWGISAGSDSIVQAAVISAIFWILMSIIAWRLYRYCQSFVRNFIAVLHTAWYRGRQAAGSLKTRIVCGLREFVPQREEHGIDAIPEIDFDDLDLAVLRSGRSPKNSSCVLPRSSAASTSCAATRCWTPSSGRRTATTTFASPRPVQHSSRCGSDSASPDRQLHAA